MSVLDSPPNPTQGQQFGEWTWDGVKWTGANPQGPSGYNAFSYVTVAFTIPAVGALVTVNVVQANWTQPGLCVFVGGMYGIVQSVAATALILARLSENPETDDNITGVVVPAASLVSPAGFPGVGVPGTPGSNETSLWIPIPPATGWNVTGWTIKCRTILNQQTLQVVGVGVPTSNLTGGNTSLMGNIPGGITLPTENRWSPVAVQCTQPPGYGIADLVLTSAGTLTLVPISLNPLLIINGVFANCNFILDNGPT